MGKISIFKSQVGKEFLKQIKQSIIFPIKINECLFGNKDVFKGNLENGVFGTVHYFVVERMWKWLINDHWSHLSISFSSLLHNYWKIYYWLAYALYRRWLPIFMEIFLKSFEVCAIDLWIQLTLFRVPSFSATDNGLMLRVFELFYLMGDLSKSPSKVLVIYVDYSLPLYDMESISPHEKSFFNLAKKLIIRNCYSHVTGIQFTLLWESTLRATALINAKFLSILQKKIYFFNFTHPYLQNTHISLFILSSILFK